MIRAYWNALRVDDDVCVHDDTDPGLAISSGTVAFVDTTAATNAVTIRITNDDTTTSLVHPKRLAVHLQERDSRTDCWRCSLRR